MAIDWFTVIAQIVNFLILVWLLKRFLYRPILNAIDAREQRIAQTLSDARQQQHQAEQEKQLFTEKNREFEAQRQALMDRASSAAAIERQQLLAQAKRAADALNAQYRKSLQQQQQEINDELSRKTQEEVFAISRRALSDLADADLEEQVVKVFLSQLQELDKDSKTRLCAAISTSSNALRIRSSFALQATQQSRLSDAIHKTFNTAIEIQFETIPEIISGIELFVNGQKLGWNIAQYIGSLEKHLQQLLQQPIAQNPHATTHNERDDE